MFRGLLILLLLAAAIALPPIARAKQPVWGAKAAGMLASAGQDLLLLAQQGRQRRDHDRARDAVGSGAVLPLQQIMRRLQRQYPGRLLDADLRQDRQGRRIYRLKLLAPGDQIQVLIVNARTGQVLQSGRRR
ncbi:MAG: peptidase [Alphaproteobacteria bacterium]|jgi:uncharacterized membrane protein YkoI|nr:peptidase [Alphaproteobacteria bacterium]